MAKERKYIIIAGAILLMAGLFYRFYPFGFDMLNKTSDFALKQKKIIKYTEAVGQKNQVEKQLKKLQRIDDQAEKIFLNGNTISLAAVDIQNILNKTAEKVGLTISRIDIGKEKKLEEVSVTSIPVSLRVVSTTRQLRDMIYYIESSEKFLRIVNVSSSVYGRKEPEQINSKITVEGFIRE